MNRPLLRQLYWAYGIFFAAMLLCTFLDTSSFRANDGISYFGVHGITIVPYTVALLVPAILIYRAAKMLNKKATLSRIFHYSFMIMALALIILALTPYSLGKDFNYVHTVAGSTLFATQFLLVIYWVANCGPKLFDYISVCLILLFGMAAAVYLPTNHGFLIQTQLVFQVIFFIWVTQTFRKEYRKINAV